jgi:hypothetical protein
MTDLTPEELERLDLARELTPLEKVQFCGELYKLAPGANSLAKRCWVADRLGLPVREVNRILWSTCGIRWTKLVARDPRPRRQKLRDEGREVKPSQGGVESLQQLCDELQFSITDILR